MDDTRPNPDALLARLKQTEKSDHGRLRVYLGAAPGVGKTYTALQEAQRRKKRGTDVVVGLVETHGRPHTREQIGDLEVIPTRDVPYGNVVLHEMDVDAIIGRKPSVVIVDELAHTNAPGAKNQKRYQDVRELLDAGIDVISTLNIQHIASLNDMVKNMTGIRVKETLPDQVLVDADQIELIDMAPEALIRRMVHGNVYPPEQARRALENFFTLENLTALRDVALRATAQNVEQKLAGYMRDFHIENAFGIGEKVMVAIDHTPTAAMLIRRGRQFAAALKSDLVVVYVEPDQGRRQLRTNEQERQLRANLQLADEFGASVVRLRGNIAEEVIAYAREQRVATLVIGPPTHGRWADFVFGSVTQDILRAAQGMDVHVVGNSSPQASRGYYAGEEE